jgi:hypothetical protein
MIDQFGWLTKIMIENRFPSAIVQGFAIGIPFPDGARCGGSSPNQRVRSTRTRCTNHFSYVIWGFTLPVRYHSPKLNDTGYLINNSGQFSVGISTNRCCNIRPARVVNSFIFVPTCFSSFNEHQTSALSSAERKKRTQIHESRRPPF